MDLDPILGTRPGTPNQRKERGKYIPLAQSPLLPCFNLLLAVIHDSGGSLEIIACITACRPSPILRMHLILTPAF